MDAAEVRLHGEFDEIEPEFHAALRESLDPRGPDALYELVDELGLPEGARVVDVACGRGRHAAELAARYGFDVLAIDAWDRFAVEAPARGAVEFRVAMAEAIPVEDGSVDLAFCRDALSLTDVDRTLDELWRVLRPGGRGLIYLTVSASRMTDDEAEPLHRHLGGRDLRAADVEGGLEARGFRIDRTVDYGGEFGELGQERDGVAGERLLFASRLLRRPERYLERFGEANYQIMLHDCLWHVFRMIGKLAGYAVTFSKP